jgi:hypothetical protein
LSLVPSHLSGSRYLVLRGSLGQVVESLAALELGILDDTCLLLARLGQFKVMYVLASASEEKLPVQVMKVWPSCLPEVTGYARMVETTEV